MKEFPPDRSPEEFEKIRDAYETLRDPRKRTRAMLLSTSPRSAGLAAGRPGAAAVICGTAALA